MLFSDEVKPVEVVNPKGVSPFVLICEHAGRAIPRALKGRGLSECDLQRHIAWDIGAGGIATRLAHILNAPLVMQRYSRLVVDCNRSLDAAASILQISEDTPIPGNMNLSDQDRASRIDSIFRPFHDTISDLLDRRQESVVVTIHSFTPSYSGEARPWHLGLVHDADKRLADAFYSRLVRLGGFVIGRNVPYGPQDGVCHTLNEHAQPRGLPHVMVEIRNDLLDTDKEQAEWAERLAPELAEAWAEVNDASVV